jgi:type IV pilus assembly protein PilV
MKINTKLRKKNTASVPKNQQGVVILEALIGLVIFSMGLLALAGLQAAMIKNTSDNKFRADATYIAQEGFGRMWTDPTNLAAYQCLDESASCADISNLLPSGRRTITVGNRGLVTITVTWQLPGQDQHNYTTSTFIGAT